MYVLGAILLVMCTARLKALKPGQPSPKSQSRTLETALLWRAQAPKTRLSILRARAEPASRGFQHLWGMKVMLPPIARVSRRSAEDGTTSQRRTP